MNIYELIQFYENRNYNREYDSPKKIMELFNSTIKQKAPLKGLIIYKYMKLKPRRFENESLNVLVENSKNRYDMEAINMLSTYVVSERFKTLIGNLGGKLDFFPILVEGEHRFLMMWRGLPVISGYETDLSKAKFYSDKVTVEVSSPVFRSDILEYYDYKMFSTFAHVNIFISESIKRKFEDNNFKFTYAPVPVTQIKYNEKKVHEVIRKAAKMERKLYFCEGQIKWLQEVDDFLEQFLIKEGDKEVLEKFRNEMKGEWKKEFEKYKNGELESEERITYW